MHTDQPTSPSMSRGAARLLADIGGTNARFAIETASGQVDAVKVLPCKDFASLADAMHAYLDAPEALACGAAGITRAALAIANPVDGDSVRMTNHDWQFSIEAVRREFGFDSLKVVNDFKALAHALPYLKAGQTVQIGGLEGKAGGVKGLLGPGTGLGVSGLIPAGSRWVALDSEGGHVSFAPANELEADILRFAWGRFLHVSAERLISGIGINLIHEALAQRAGVLPENLAPAEIFRRAMAGESALCDQTVECFCEMLGTVAANLAVTLGAKGGIYIGGGIVPRLGSRFMASGFRKRFEQKGRFSHFLSEIPVYVITAPYPAFTGLSALLDEQA